MLQQVNATRFVAPLREGGSLPGIVEADDLGMYVTKFRGAGQGIKVLVAEIIVAELARRLGFLVPELRIVQLEAIIGKYEADEEVQDLLTASVGANLGLDFLPGAFGWDAGCEVSAAEASRVLWLDAFTANVDRSWRNPNLLVWHGAVWLIDHGAALYFHHSWAGRAPNPQRFADQPYDASEHVLIQHVTPAALERANHELVLALTPSLLKEVVAEVPDEWLEVSEFLPGPAAVRQAYVDHLSARLGAAEVWLPAPGVLSPAAGVPSPAAGVLSPAPGVLSPAPGVP